jgi:RNA polymerase sigma-70 factor, ECF subfamily
MVPPAECSSFGPSAAPHDDALSREAVTLAKRGDRDALRYLYVTYASAVNRRVRGIVQDAHEAEDFTKLVTALAKYEEREVPFSAWILRVAQNAALDHLKRRRQLPSESVHATDNGRDQLGLDRRRCLKTALAGLPKPQREVLLLHNLVGLSLGEIAHKMGKSEGAVTQLHYRGRTALRGALVELDSAPRTQRRRRSG